MDFARNGSLDRLLEDAEHSIAAHWDRCRETGVAGANKEATDRVDASIHAYFMTLKSLSRAAPEEKIIAAISALYDDLMLIDRETGGGLLEEAERELLEPLILNAAEAVGLDRHKFMRRQPTGRPLDFGIARG